MPRNKSEALTTYLLNKEINKDQYIPATNELGNCHYKESSLLKIDAQAEACNQILKDKVVENRNNQFITRPLSQSNHQVNQVESHGGRKTRKCRKLKRTRKRNKRKSKMRSSYKRRKTKHRRKK